MSFRKIYQEAVYRKGYHNDPAQAKVVGRLDALYRELLAYQPRSLIARLAKSLRGNDHSATVKGCYLWGGVGQGKTWLMDLFFNETPTQSKLRYHFHEFMQHIHLALSEFKFQKDPLKSVAQSLVQKAHLFCVDEFHVSDIADAMLLHGLLEEMYRQGAVFVITSNMTPDELYKNGLQRSRFVPAIELIKNNNRILEFNGAIDYRVQKNLQTKNYYCPLQANTDQQLLERFNALARGHSEKDSTITIVNRTILTRAKAENIVWFDFDVICGGPRAAVDYLALAKQYEIVIISNIYKMDESHDDLARRFINLIDAFYDRRVGLIISATAWPGELYKGRRFKFEFERTLSRLEDIRSMPLIKSTKNTGNTDKISAFP